MLDKIIVILGQTSSGKSELAVKIAKKHNGEIISADSRQIYKGLDIGSGKITKKEMKGVPHHLINIASPKKTFSVAQYQKLAKKTLTDILKRSKLPIICGGTGLYIDSIIYGTKFPEVPPQPKLRKKLGKLTTEKLFEKLKKFDPRRAKNIDKHNRRRLIRALEIVIFTGKPISPAIRTDSGYDILKIGVALPKKKLKKRIVKRIKQMLKNGLLNEIKKLRKPNAPEQSSVRGKQKLSWEKIYSFGFEYKYPAMFLQNKISKEEMIEIMEKENWRYAKRQMTWFKRDKNIIWIGKLSQAQKPINEFIDKN